MVDNYWFMLALVAAYLIITNFINVRIRKKQDDAPAEGETAHPAHPVRPVNTVHAAKATLPPRKGASIHVASSPEALSKRRNKAGW